MRQIEKTIRVRGSACFQLLGSCQVLKEMPCRGAYGAEIVALVLLFAYPVAMFAEIEPIERELLARLRVGVYHVEDSCGGGWIVRGCDAAGGLSRRWRGGDCADGAGWLTILPTTGEWLRC